MAWSGWGWPASHLAMGVQGGDWVGGLLGPPLLEGSAVAMGPGETPWISHGGHFSQC